MEITKRFLIVNQILREKAIIDYLEARIIEILDNIESIQKKHDKLIAKLFRLVKHFKQITLQEFLRIKSEKVKKAILDNFFREYNQCEVDHEKYEESNDKFYKIFIQFPVNYDEKAESLEIDQHLVIYQGLI
jgi:hypothetical protein